MAVLDAHCEKLGRDPAEIYRTAVALLILTDDEKLAAKMNATEGSPARIAGSVSQLQDIVAEYQAVGVDELIIPDFTLGMDLNEQKLSTLDTFISSIAPSGRA